MKQGFLAQRAPSWWLVAALSAAPLLQPPAYANDSTLGDAEFIGSDESPWVVTSDAILEPVEVFPDTPEELDAAMQGVVPRGILEDQAKVLTGGQQVFIDIMRDMSKSLPVRSTGCDRDDMMATNAMIILGSAGMVPGLSVMGAGAGFFGGAVAGGIVSAEIGGLPGAATFGLAGAVAGGGAGLAAGSAQFGLVGLFVANNTLEVVRTTEPCGQVQQRSADGAGADEGLPAELDEAQYWVDFAEPEETGEDASGVQERAARVVGTARAVRPIRLTGRYAGEYESLYIHLLKALYTDHVYDVSRNWDRSRYVPANARAAMRHPSVRRALKPAIDHIAYVKRYGKLPDGLPAKPMNKSRKSVFQLLTGDTAAMRDMWLRAMGMGETRLRVNNGRLTWNTPSALRVVGLAPSITYNMPARSFAAGPLRAKVNPGPFDLVLGKAAIEGSRVRVNYTISRNSRIGALAFDYRKPTGGWQNFFNYNARLGRTVSGRIYYRFTSAGPMIDSVSFGSASVGLPSITAPPIPGLGNALNTLRSQVQNQLARYATSALPVRNVLNRAADAGKNNLLKVLRQQAGALGFSSVTQVSNISVQNGKLTLRVGGYKTEFALPQLPSATVLKRKIDSYRGRFQAKARRR